ncbi:putative membrane protein [Confluentimicrobium naphthalenivorans]|uniref:Putative membrane protein n=1 Tax=Actibacterium naphthalenivorans TaxID=1614693 RepID=A0A840CBD0_9RHOB|nr:putative membrane protein [Actibacterium naphthalenivorans]
MRHYPTSGNRLATVARRVLLLAALGFVPVAAQAYVGPGLGAGAIAAVLGVLGSIFLALFAVIYYPIKRMLKKRKKATPVEIVGDSAEE